MARRPRIRSAPVPSTRLPYLLPRRIDLADAHEADLPDGVATDPELWARRIFHRTPRWVAAALVVRNAVVAPFGLRRPSRATRGFPILGRTDDEVVLGVDDRHLDFRVSVLTRPTAHGGALVVVTRVLIHGALGRAYMALVWPVHPFVVRAMIGRALAD